MNIKMLEITPFGFVFELENNKPYESGAMYSLFLNNQEVGVYTQNVISVFGLNPNTYYEGKLKAKDHEILFEVTTQEVNFVINVGDYNAIGNGIADDTAAINTAIYTAPKGAVVYVPAGTYLVNTIFLKSDIDLYLEKDAVLMQTTNRQNLSIIKGFQKNYQHTDVTINTSWEGSPLDTYGHVIYGLEVENTRIYGYGSINGQGEEGNWWKEKGGKSKAYRPRNIFLNCCQNMSIIGITSRNSASWNTHPFYCTNMRFYGMWLKSPHDSANTDGINPESSVNIEIIGCRFDVGDDCIAIKSGKYFMSQFKLQPTENITIRNCYMGDGHGGIALGSEISGGVKNLTVSQCLMEGTDRGIRIKTRRGRGKDSILDGIRLSNIQMKKVQHGIALNMFYFCDPDGKTLYVRDKTVTVKDDMTPTIRDVEIDNVRAEDIRGCGIFMYGLPENKIDGVKIRNCHFGFAEGDARTTTEQPEMLEGFIAEQELGVFIKNAANVTLDNNTFSGEYTTEIDEQR